MTQISLIAKLSTQHIKDFCRRQQIKHLWLIGSYAKGNNHSGSDVDLLYEYDDKAPFVDWGIIGAYSYLQEYLQQKVDLIDKDYIKPNIRDSILSSKIAIW